ncbi:MAG: TetR/AcrR family transcriptional regulator [Bacillota bacterium]|nr:TetR/AcrR family transcriptional regulator [Bacillota bacterium]
MDNARKAFSKAGVKKTTIEDLTNSVGIAKGSFYIFFKSKEALYFEILKQEIAGSVPIKDITAETPGLPFNQFFRKFLHQAVDSMQTNPILKLMLIPEEYQIVYRRITADSENSEAMDIITPLAIAISKWQSEGTIIKVDAYLLANVVKCLFLLTTHQDEIGNTVFPDVMSYLINVIADNFTHTVG